jgi:hypothetical protein
MTPGYDIIGDVHGCASKLEGLLGVLGYECNSGTYEHSERQAIFVGDLIDRGDDHIRTLDLVRAMVESENAKIVMGNHEFNAISYATPNPEIPGEFMRVHSDRNRANHKEFTDQVQVASGYYADSIEWFKSLPLYLELEGLRVIHACWNDAEIDLVRQSIGPGEPMPTEFVVRANQKGSAEHKAIEVLLKGPEVDLRDYGLPAVQLPGDRLRNEARIRWWNPNARTLREVAEIQTGSRTETGEIYPDLPDTPCNEKDTQYGYDPMGPLLFYGHYWRKWNPDELPEWVPEKGLDWTKNSACVDFSAVRSGPLVAYRWSGEAVVDPKNYVCDPSWSDRSSIS